MPAALAAFDTSSGLVFSCGADGSQIVEGERHFEQIAECLVEVQRMPIDRLGLVKALQAIEQAAQSFNPPRGGNGIRVDIKRMLLARAMVPLAGNQPLVAAIQQHGQQVFGEPIPAVGTPLYTDVRLYVEHGIPGVIYGAGPRTVLESNAKRADENLALDDLKRATKVIARTLADLLVG